MNRTQVCLGIREAQHEAHRIAVAHGWWDTDRPITEALLKIIVEVAEGVQALEKGNPPDKHLPQYGSLSVELADVVIRVLDLADALKIDLASVIIDKMEYNEGRPYRHGKAL